MKSIVDFDGEKLVLMHPCQTCGIEIESGDLCKQCLIDAWTDDHDDECGQCDGSGFWYHCIDGCCINAEEGCDMCARRCDFCNPFKPTPEQADERAKLGQILAEAIEKNKEQK